MYDEEAQKYIKNHFGTSKIGDCKHCTQSKNGNSWDNLPCGQFKCIMLTKLEMFENERLYKQSSDVNHHVRGMMNKMSKMNMLGFREEIIPPWVIMRDQSKENAGWFNSKLQVYGNKLYKDILTVGDMLICINDFRLTKTSKVCEVEIFSLACGDANLAFGIPNLVYKIKTTGITGYGSRNPGYIVCDAKDDCSGQKVKVIISKFGNRIAVMNDSKIIVTKRDNTILVELPTFKQVIRLTQTLEVMHKTSSAIVIPL